MWSCDLTFLFLNNGTSLEIVLSFMIDASLSDFMFWIKIDSQQTFFSSKWNMEGSNLALLIIPTFFSL